MPFGSAGLRPGSVGLLDERCRSASEASRAGAEREHGCAESAAQWYRDFPSGATANSSAAYAILAALGNNSDPGSQSDWRGAAAPRSPPRRRTTDDTYSQPAPVSVGGRQQRSPLSPPKRPLRTRHAHGAHSPPPRWVAAGRRDGICATSLGSRVRKFGLIPLAWSDNPDPRCSTADAIPSGREADLRIN